MRKGTNKFLIEIPQGFSSKAATEIKNVAKVSAKKAAEESAKEAASRKIEKFEEVLQEIQIKLERARELSKNRVNVDMVQAKMLFMGACGQLNSIAAFKTEAAILEEVAKLFSGSSLKITAIDLARKAKLTFEKVGDTKGVARMEKLLSVNEKGLREYGEQKAKDEKGEKEIKEKTRNFERELREQIKIKKR